ncbi:Cytochrome P450 [Mycena venus]|uniref:Cytochrome P450 n=1 Tax=Mycena venus TaxID=2733690 RepID=A0A8H6TWY4_9AGAR|nr:Cytochrome P450 [Mycena venus]
MIPFPCLPFSFLCRPVLYNPRPSFEAHSFIMLSLISFIYGIILTSIVYGLVQVCRPGIALYRHLHAARRTGLPFKVIPFPPGLFSFFVFQVLKKLRLLKPGTKLHKLLNMGRPDGYELHEEMGDVFLTVSPMGLTMIVADPKVATMVNGKRSAYPKPPNTGAIINIYGRNVINTDGDIWRFHRRVTGPVFSERIHSDVWREGMRQAEFMMQSWTPTSPGSLRANSIGGDLFRLGLNVITGSAYGTPLTWSSDPPCAVNTALSYRESMEQLTAHLMPIFLTPHRALRLARKDSAWGRAWEAYTAFGGYMKGMLDQEKEKPASPGEENLITVLLRAQAETDEKLGRTMSESEVMGNMFIMLFAGHETTANTLHYALLCLALHHDIQDMLLSEIDSIYERALKEGRTELDYEKDFSSARWAFATMYETTRVYTPTGMINKWTASDQTISFDGQSYVIPQGTRISVNGVGIHFNPKVWGEDAKIWDPSRWMVSDGEGPTFTPAESRSGSPMPPSPGYEKQGWLNINTPPASPRYPRFNINHNNEKPTSSVMLEAPPTPHTPHFLGQRPPSPALSVSSQGILKPTPGTFLPFSEGSRACSGKKFATVEFVVVVFTLLRRHRVGLAEGCTAEWARKVMSGRKAGGITLQPPEDIPLLFTPR